ncbi:MAG TPA: NUDIX domain-containing protein [Candidatus Kapabacteria bacterium]|jgi:ADP-ribose pyrophosphatase YjhB (NUDIX family)|nr:NUDIX domain-containing protein [Candidatus Kapabacteria bacterium]
MKATLVVSAGVLSDGRLLMVQEGKEGSHGLWGLPGGRVEPGERILDAIDREVREETGLDVRVSGITRVVRYYNMNGHHTMRFNFVVEPIGGELRVDGTEILDARWMDYDEIAAMADEHIRTAAVARQIMDDVRHGRIYPVDIVLDVIR